MKTPLVALSSVILFYGCVGEIEELSSDEIFQLYSPDHSREVVVYEWKEEEFSNTHLLIYFDQRKCGGGAVVFDDVNVNL